jgi:hypothetical protein
MPAPTASVDAVQASGPGRDSLVYLALFGAATGGLILFLVSVRKKS